MGTSKLKLERVKVRMAGIETSDPKGNITIGVNGLSMSLFLIRKSPEHLKWESFCSFSVQLGNSESSFAFTEDTSKPTIYTLFSAPGPTAVLLLTAVNMGDQFCEDT